LGGATGAGEHSPACPRLPRGRAPSSHIQRGLGLEIFFTIFFIKKFVNFCLIFFFLYLLF
jgi:hypothetical protein